MAICHNGKEGGLVSRRSFLKGGVAVGGAALVGGVLGGCSPQQSGSDAAPLSPVGLPETWDAELCRKCNKCSIFLLVMLRDLRGCARPAACRNLTVPGRAAAGSRVPPASPK